MKKFFFSFALICIATVTSAQLSQTPVKIFNDGDIFLQDFLFTYADLEQVIIHSNCNDKSMDDDTFIKIYDLSFSSKKDITFSTSTISGYRGLSVFGLYDGSQENQQGTWVYMSEKLFNPDKLLEFIVETTNGFVIVNENYQELFRKSYTGIDFSSGNNYLNFSILQTKNGNILVVNITKWTQTGVGEYGMPTGTYSYTTEYYALPGYTAPSGFRSASIEQLSNPYPNPAKTYIQLPYSLPQGVKEGKVCVFDAQGKMIKTFQVDGAFEYVRLDTTNLPSGNYFFTLESRGQKSESKPFIVKK